MRWVDQTSPIGCVPACISSITSIPLAEIPDFMALRDGRGWNRVRLWLKQRGWLAVNLRGAHLGVGRGYVLLRGSAHFVRASRR